MHGAKSMAEALLQAEVQGGTGPVARMTADVQTHNELFSTKGCTLLPAAAGSVLWHLLSDP
jgi:hypothetical protein